jgi:hypothetical protein
LDYLKYGITSQCNLLENDIRSIKPGEKTKTNLIPSGYSCWRLIPR